MKKKWNKKAKEMGRETKVDKWGYNRQTANKDRETSKE